MVFVLENEVLNFLGMVTKLGLNAKGLQVVKGSSVEIRDVFGHFFFPPACKLNKKI